MKDYDELWNEYAGAFNEKLEGENGGDWSRLDETQQEIAALWKLAADMYNGGFDQFFLNWGYECYTYAMRGIKRIADANSGSPKAECKKVYRLFDKTFRKVFARFENDNRIQSYGDILEYLTAKDEKVLEKAYDSFDEKLGPLLCMRAYQYYCGDLPEDALEKEPTKLKFANLFHKEQKEQGVPITLDLRDDGFILNGVRFPFPARASELIKLLGEPRIAENQSGEIMKKIYCEEYHLNPDTYNPWDYYWDSMGIFVRTHEHETVHSLFIYLRKSTYPFPMPKCYFSGTLLIRGEPWQKSILKKGGLHGAFPLGDFHLNVSMKGSETREKSVQIIELGLNSDEELEFFNKAFSCETNSGK